MTPEIFESEKLKNIGIFNDRLEFSYENFEHVLKPGGIAELDGFRGFSNKSIVDVGTRDGRFAPMFKRLGARKVVGVDCDADALEKAIRMGNLAEDEVVHSRVEDLPSKYLQKFDIACVFNFCVPVDERSSFVQKTSYLLVDDPSSQMVVTVAEQELVSGVYSHLNQCFSQVRGLKLWSGKTDLPHSHILMAERKRT